MVKLQASIVNAPSLCTVEQETQGGSVTIVAELTAELEREKQKNAELMERISFLEAQIQGSHAPKRQNIESENIELENVVIAKNELSSSNGKSSESLDPGATKAQDHLVNWISMEDIQVVSLAKLKDSDSAADLDDSDDSDHEYDHNYGDDDEDANDDSSHGEVEETTIPFNVKNNQIQVSNDEGSQLLHLRVKSEPTSIQQEELYQKNELEKPLRVLSSEKEGSHATAASKSLSRNLQKVAFCPEEVKRIIGSEGLLEKNGQSHTMRKIIVFASLGIRHGCEDMYELDFNHFSILRKGEPYVSPGDPEEHVLYENPGVQRKIFCANRQNPILCPVQILEEEKSMRPADSSCPSCLFLCIKYGGRTRNLPQNEYVRQRMGRIKLKSFGPLICQMAMLANVRSGSFFFKALGITLLFMAGFPDELVQKETKHRNLDLLQKYYRTDKDAEGEELFVAHTPISQIASPDPKHFIAKSNAKKSKRKRPTKSEVISPNLQRQLCQQVTPSSLAPPGQLGVASYSSTSSHSTSSFHYNASKVLAYNSQTPNPPSIISGANSNRPPNLYHHFFPPQPTSSFVPMMYWPSPNAFPYGIYPSACGYQYMPSAANCISRRWQPYQDQFGMSPSSKKESDEKNVDLAESDKDSSSNSTEQKQKSATSK